MGEEKAQGLNEKLVEAERAVRTMGEVIQRYHSLVCVLFESSTRYVEVFGQAASAVGAALAGAGQATGDMEKLMNELVVAKRELAGRAKDGKARGDTLEGLRKEREELKKEQEELATLKRELAARTSGTDGTDGTNGTNETNETNGTDVE